MKSVEKTCAFLTNSVIALLHLNESLGQLKTTTELFCPTYLGIGSLFPSFPGFMASVGAMFVCLRMLIQVFVKETLEQAGFVFIYCEQLGVYP